PARIVDHHARPIGISDQREAEDEDGDDEDREKAPAAGHFLTEPVLIVSPGQACDWAGGAEGNRTPDLCSAIAALSHLSYSPAPPPYVKPDAKPQWGRARERAAPLAACFFAGNHLSRQGFGWPI